MGYPLNEEQRLAVETLEGPVVCISGPGSGKTTVIVERDENLISRGVSPNNLLTLTFTSQAAKELTDRSSICSTAPRFRTFHSFALAVLKKERERLPYALTPDIIPMPNDIFQTICNLLRAYRTIPNYKTLVEGISMFKHRGLSPEQALEDSYGDGIKYVIASAYRDYERICRENGWLDFDSIMAECVRLLEAEPDIRTRNQFEYVQVDEGQDTDNTQFRLLRCISKGNIFVVGDENQLIYEWRSAMPGSLSQFAKMFEGARTLYLGTNYRSTQALVAYFKQILPVDNGIASHMRPSPQAETGIAPTYTEYRGEVEEAEAVIASAIDPEHTAVIARTNRQLEMFRHQCLRRGMKFRFLGKSGFWDQSEVKKLVSMLKEDKAQFRRTNAGLAVQAIVERSGLIGKYKTQWKFGDSDPQENINGVYKIAVRFDSVDEFLAYVTKISHASHNKTGIILSTVHQMKGKEADHVYLVGACNGILPHQKGALAEEQRIFYVACSRAAKALHISYYGPPSLFIRPFLEGAQTVRDIPGSQVSLFEK